MYSWTSEGQGQPLVEVFGVRFLHGGEAPAGTVCVYDGKRGQIIYSGDKPPSHPRRSDELPLTGPYRAVSADGCVAFVLDLHHRRDNNAASSSEILLDVYDEATRYDELTTRDDGRGAKVTYALLSDAAEATVQVRLLGQRAGHTVRGTVIAQTGLGEMVLFDNDDGARVGTGTEEAPAGVLPLARSVVAVALTSLLTVVVNLVVIDGDGEESVTASVVCVPELGIVDVQRRPTTGATAVEVEVTWLD